MESTFIYKFKNDDIKKSALSSSRRQENTKANKNTMIVNNSLKRELPVRSLLEQLNEFVKQEFERIK